MERTVYHMNIKKKYKLSSTSSWTRKQAAYLIIIIIILCRGLLCKFTGGTSHWFASFVPINIWSDMKKLDSIKFSTVIYQNNYVSKDYSVIKIIFLTTCSKEKTVFSPMTNTIIKFTKLIQNSPIYIIFKWWLDWTILFWDIRF